MRHATRTQRLSRATDQKEALVDGLLRGLIRHGQIETTLARAKEAQRAADRLVSLGKDGSIHARRRAFRRLQDRTLVSRLFLEIAPRFGDTPGGYTRVLRTTLRRGDGAQQAVLAFSKLPVKEAAAPAPKAATARPTGPGPAEPAAEGAPKEKPKGFLDGLRGLWTKRRKEGTHLRGPGA